MALGYYVDQGTINQKSGQTALALRSAFDQVAAMSAFLANNPNPGGGEADPLTAKYGYTEDEAYALRVFVEGWDAIRKGQTAQELFTTGRKLTGLE
ncbi:hypothetical protein SEA_KARDASHIAN_20 [Streptomyces phage Kardashian]|nr:hypothetical protein SEA_KARDASHIAN_20 [Streptomyces phage Kardashian]